MANCALSCWLEDWFASGTLGALILSNAFPLLGFFKLLLIFFDGSFYVLANCHPI